MQGGAQAPCTPWLQGADPWSRSRALPVVQSITSTTTSTPRCQQATPAQEGASAEILPPSRREEALLGPTMAGAGSVPPAVPALPRRAAPRPRGTARPRFARPATGGSPRRGRAGGTGELPTTLVAGTGRCHARTSPRWDPPGSVGIPTQDPAGSSLGLVPGRRPQALFAPQAVVFPDPRCRRCQETPDPPRCSSAMSQEVFLPPGPAGCRASAGSCHLCPAAGALVPPQPRGPGGPRAARPVLHCPALLSSPPQPQRPSTERTAPSTWSCLASGDPGTEQGRVAVPGRLPGARRAGPCGEQTAEPLTNRKFLITSRSLGYPARAVQRKEAKARGEKVRVRSANRRPVQRSRVHQSKETLMC